MAPWIRQAIQLGRYAWGGRLPSEGQLVDQLGFSRVTVREAIRHLEGEGYIDTRRGAKGGLFVRRQQAPGVPTRRTACRMAAGLSRSFSSTASRPNPALLASPPSGAMKAHLARLGEALAAFFSGGQSSDFRRADSVFHLAVAQVSANPHLQLAFEEARAGLFMPFDAVEFLPELWAEQPDQHAAIFDAIHAGDAERAAAAMNWPPGNVADPYPEFRLGGRRTVCAVLSTTTV